MQFSPLVLSLGATAPSVVAGLLRLTAGTVVCYRTFLVAMVTPAAVIFWGLLAVDQDVAEPLTVAAVCESTWVMCVLNFIMMLRRLVTVKTCDI